MGRRPNKNTRSDSRDARRPVETAAIVADRGVKPWLLAAALVAAVFLVYQPAWRGGFVWDDDGHVTRPELRSWHGLYRIWFDLGATQQYYPLVHSAFWVEHKLWGDAPSGYHLVSILLHATAALLVALILRRLVVPGACLAAAVFALHPVHVESVAWISELKNTLSAVFYLGAALVYLRFDETRKARWYAAALGLFVLALLSKTVTATLPAALLVVFWWQRGRLSWRRDVWPLAPFLVLGAVAGAFTAWVEHEVIGAEGAAFEMTTLERFLIAGRAIWFYLGKLAWPADLLFVYPRWHVSQAVWWQYLYPAAVLAMAAALWLVRGRSRAPLAAGLFFAGTLVPVLGFFNVYPFLYSFVADHFQYLASLGMISLASAGAAIMLERWRLWRRPAGYLLCLTLLSVLAALTWHQSRMYADVARLYQATVDKNPDCWMAHNNLAGVLVARGRAAEAIGHYQNALAVKPGLAETHNNLGAALACCGRLDEAIDEYRKALDIQPSFPQADYNLALALTKPEQAAEAVVHYQKTLEANPDYAEAHNNLGNALLNCKRVEAAIEHYQAAIRIKPDYAQSHHNLGNVYLGLGQSDDAIAQYREALRFQPADAETHNTLGVLLLQKHRVEEAIGQFQEALAINPGYVEARQNLEVARAARQ
jgi:protein O-mannosyl-transferase